MSSVAVQGRWARFLDSDLWFSFRRSPTAIVATVIAVICVICAVGLIFSVFSSKPGS